MQSLHNVKPSLEETTVWGITLRPEGQSFKPLRASNVKRVIDGAGIVGALVEREAAPDELPGLERYAHRVLTAFMITSTNSLPSAYEASLSPGSRTTSYSSGIPSGAKTVILPSSSWSTRSRMSSVST